MAPRWWDWTILLVALTLGGGWVALDMPGLPLSWLSIAPHVVPAVMIAAAQPLTPLAPPLAPQPVDHHAITIQAPTIVKKAPGLAMEEPPSPPPQTKPRLPEVVRPSGGESPEAQANSTTVVSSLPAVIRPSDRSQLTGQAGTGFFIASDGSIMTVAHVVRACRTIAVVSRYVKETLAQLLAIDHKNDVAVLRAKNIRPPAVLALAERPSSAENLEIFGYPGDGDRLVPTAVPGRLRTERMSFNGADRRDFLWLDANAVRTGFSGGPILNTSGDVIGLINGDVTQRTTTRGVVVRDIKYVFGASTRTINTFLSEETPTLIPDAGRGPPLDEVDKAIVHVLCVY